MIVQRVIDRRNLKYNCCSLLFGEGSSLQTTHLDEIRRMNPKEIIVIMDNDPTGIKATEKHCGVLIQHFQCPIRFVKWDGGLKSGYDINDLYVDAEKESPGSGDEAVAELIAKAVPWEAEAGVPENIREESEVCFYTPPEGELQHIPMEERVRQCVEFLEQCRQPHRKKGARNVEMVPDCPVHVAWVFVG